MKQYSEVEVEQFLANLERIEDANAKKAYLFLVTHARSLDAAYEVRPGQHGYIKDVRYYLDGDWCFSFIPNRLSLLWYFRRPFLKLHNLDISTLEKDFSEVKTTGSEEFTVRLSSYDDALRVTAYLP